MSESAPVSMISEGMVWSQRRKDRHREKGRARNHRYGLVEGLQWEEERQDRCFQVMRDEEDVLKQRGDRCWEKVQR